METVKNIAAIIGLFLSCITVLTLVSKKAREIISSTIRKHSKADSSEASIEEVKQLLLRHIEDDAVFKREMMAQNDITLDFTKTQCRNLIKNIFYRYEASETLPLYEKKTLMTLKELYVDRLAGNSYAELLLKEMEGWDIDYSKGHDE